jgi:hypothetical protein
MATAPEPAAPRAPQTAGNLRVVGHPPGRVAAARLAGLAEQRADHGLGALRADGRGPARGPSARRAGPPGLPVAHRPRLVPGGRARVARAPGLARRLAGAHPARVVDGASPAARAAVARGRSSGGRASAAGGLRRLDHDRGQLPHARLRGCGTPGPRTAWLGRCAARRIVVGASRDRGHRSARDRAGTASRPGPATRRAAGTRGRVAALAAAHRRRGTLGHSRPRRRWCARRSRVRAARSGGSPIPPRSPTASGWRSGSLAMAARSRVPTRRDCSRMPRACSRRGPCC